LHLACEHGDIETVEVLIKYGADLFLGNKDKVTPFMISEKKKDLSAQYEKIYSYLLEIK
jgi:ankyrin repeat protein